MKLKFIFLLSCITFFVFITGCSLVFDDYNSLTSSEDHVNEKIRIKGTIIDDDFSLHEFNGIRIEDEYNYSIFVVNNSKYNVGDYVLIKGTFKQDLRFGYYLVEE
jgi:hypothetical protein